jgi:serine/threonine-protein kinase
VYRLAEGSIEESSLDARALLMTPSPDGLVSPTAPTIEMPAAQAIAALELERAPAAPSGLNSGIFREVVPAPRKHAPPTGMVPLYDFDGASKAPAPEATAPLTTTVVRRRRIEPVSAIFLVLLLGGTIAGGVMKALEPAKQSPFEALSALFSAPAASAHRAQPEAIPEVVVTPPAPPAAAPLAVAAVGSSTKAAPLGELALPTPLPQPKHAAKPVRHAKPAKRSRVAAALPAPASAPVAADEDEAPRMAAGDGSLSVGSSPWTEVYVDGIKLGQTPIVRHALPAGKHELRLINEEKGLDRTLNVEVRAGREAKEYLKLGRGHVRFVVSPSGTVQMNGKTLGTTPLPDMDLYEGAYRFTFFNKETRKAEVREVNVKAGDDLILKVDLRPES